jgi:hypothetical protein
MEDDMAYQCKGCDEIVDVSVKPKTCPKCQQKFKGWTLVVSSPDVEARETSSVPEWDGAATVALTTANLVTGQTLDALGGQHGFPSATCLNALYAAIEVPKGGKLAKSIYFNAFAANYDKDTAKLTGKVSIATNTPYTINSTASQCAERGLWKSVGTSLTGVTLLGIGQTTRPCLLCCARFSALAASKGVTIMIYFEKKYDALPGNTWLLFPPTVGTAGYTS